MKFKLTLCYCFLTFTLLAQFADNFELLDHNARSAQAGASICLKNSLIYVSHNNHLPMTTVNISTGNKEIQTIFESPYSSFSKIESSTDSTATIYVYNLFDYDVSLNGVYIIHCLPNSYSIDTILNSYSNSNGFVVNDIAIDSTSNYYALDYESLHFIEDGVSASSYTTNLIYHRKLYLSDNKDVFLFGKNQLHYFNGNNISLVKEFPQNILAIHNHGENHLVLFKGQLMLYNSDFSLVLSDWKITDNISSFKNILVQNQNTFLLSSTSDSFSIQQLSVPDALELLHTGDLGIDEKITGIISNNDSRFLFEGSFKTDNISSNLFFRNYSLTEPNHYSDSNVELQSFKLSKTHKDTNFVSITPYGDSVIYYTHFYEAQLVFRNLSDDTIRNLNCYSRDYFNFFGISPFYYFDLKDEILPQQTFQLDTSFTISPYFISQLPLAFPGANYQFNRSNERLVVADFTSDVSGLPAAVNFNLYPNPSSDFVFMDSNEKISSIAIYNALGQLVFLQHSTGISNAIDIRNFDTGQYYIHCTLSGSNKRITSKFIKI